MTELSTIIHDQKPTFLAVRSDNLIEFEREAGFALQILQGNGFLAKIAMSNQASLANAINNVAAIGISLNPASKLAYLVPRSGAVCLDISYMGLMHIAQQSGAIVWGQARIVHQLDKFQMEGIDKPPTHSYDPFGTDEQRGPIIGAYVVVKTDGGDYLTHAMAIGRIYDIRDRSEAYKKKSGPWMTDPEEMIKKTVIKQAAKTWPRRDRLDSAIHNLDTSGEGITFEGDAAEKMDEGTVQDWIAAITETTTKEAAKAKWQEGIKACAELNDRDAADRLKAILLTHAEKLDAGNGGPADQTGGFDDE
jgi:recombination protein RecT